MSETFYTTKEVAKMLGVSTHRISDFRKYGLLRGTRWGIAWFYEKEDVEEFIVKTKGKDLANFTKMTVEAVQRKYL